MAWKKKCRRLERQNEELTKELLKLRSELPGMIPATVRDVMVDALQEEIQSHLHRIGELTAEVQIGHELTREVIAQRDKLQLSVVALRKKIWLLARVGDRMAKRAWPAQFAEWTDAQSGRPRRPEDKEIWDTL